MKQIPPKIDAGFAPGSETELFVNDLSMFGLPSDPGTTHPTLAAVGKKYVVLNYGNGSAPMYFQKTTGTKIGEVTLGAAKATGAVTSDDCGNMLICNLAKNGEKLEIYKTNDPTKAPEKIITYTNGLGVDIGARLHVYGDLNGNAVITATPSACQNAIRWIVKNGKIGEPENKLFNVKKEWGGLDAIAKVASVDETGQKGAVCDYYADGDCQMYYFADWATPTKLVSNPHWGYNPGAIDVRSFNNCRYIALFEMGYWPSWGQNGSIFIYDATNPTAVTGSNSGSSALKYTWAVTDGTAGAAAGGRFADVLLTPSEDGYFMYVFYVSNTHNTFAGLQTDCIKK